MDRRLVLWDFDGTLANTLSLALTNYNELAARYGFRPVEDPESVRHLNMHEFLKQYNVPKWRVPGLFASFLKSMQTAIRSVPLFPGIAEAIRELQGDGMEHAVVSSNSTANIHSCLKHNDAGDLFRDVCGTSRLFGKERRIRSALKQFDTPADHCLYIGDEVRDVEAAAAAGVAVGCVSWGLNAREVLCRHTPAFIADATNELPALIRHHFGTTAP